MLKIWNMLMWLYHFNLLLWGSLPSSFSPAPRQSDRCRAFPFQVVLLFGDIHLLTSRRLRLYCLMEYDTTHWPNADTLAIAFFNCSSILLYWDSNNCQLFDYRLPTSAGNFCNWWIWSRILVFLVDWWPFKPLLTQRMNLWSLRV